MNFTAQDDLDEMLESARTDTTAVGATGKRLRFAVTDAPFESKLVSTMSDAERAQVEAERAEAARISAELDAARAAQRKKRANPRGDRILIRDLVTPEKQNGVVIPESARYLTAEGLVVAVGPGLRRPDGTRLPMETKVGEVIKYTPYTGFTFQLNGENLRVLREGDILVDIDDESGDGD